MSLYWKNWQEWHEWHEYMTHMGADATVDDIHFLTEGGCPKCACKSWEITSDGWAYCNGCGYGQSQDFDVSEIPYVRDICPDHPWNCAESYTGCRKKWTELKQI